MCLGGEPQHAHTDAFGQERDSGGGVATRLSRSHEGRHTFLSKRKKCVPLLRNSLFLKSGQHLKLFGCSLEQIFQVHRESPFVPVPSDTSCAANNLLGQPHRSR